MKNIHKIHNFVIEIDMHKLYKDFKKVSKTPRVWTPIWLITTLFCTADIFRLVLNPNVSLPYLFTTLSGIALIIEIVLYKVSYTRCLIDCLLSLDWSERTVRVLRELVDSEFARRLFGDNKELLSYILTRRCSCTVDAKTGKFRLQRDDTTIPYTGQMDADEVKLGLQGRNPVLYLSRYSVTVVSFSKEIKNSQLFHCNDGHVTQLEYY